MRDVGQAGSDMSAPVIEEEFDVLVVGAGAAGIGVGVALKYAGIENIVVIDRPQLHRLRRGRRKRGLSRPVSDNWWE